MQKMIPYNKQYQEQWRTDIELLSSLLGYQNYLSDNRPSQIGDLKDIELAELYLVRDQIPFERLTKEFNDKFHIDKCQLVFMNSYSALAIKDKSVKIDSEIRISKDGKTWGTAFSVPKENVSDLTKGIKIQNLQQFLFKRFEQLINIECKGAENPFKKIVTLRYRPVMLSDLWDALDFLKNGDLEKVLRQEQARKEVLVDAMIGNRLRVFISSVQKELDPERSAISGLISSDPFLLENCEAVLFDKEPINGKKASKPYLDLLGTCQIYLLLINREYGTPHGNLSATHHEYRFAQKRKLPTLVFVKGNDDHTRALRTRKFFAEIKKDHYTYKRFVDRLDLRVEVRAAIIIYSDISNAA